MMSPDDFLLALRALDAPVFLDNQGIVGPLGVEFTATTTDGKNVLVTQLSPALNSQVTDPDAFVATLERGGYQGAGITESGQLYFLEFPPLGISLARRIETDGPVLVGTLVAIARAAIDALGRIPFVEEPHGMITPLTLHVAADGTVSIRWPRLFSALMSAGVGTTTIVHELSSIAFVAPEVRTGSTVDVRSDVFALGATLYAALTGRQPFGGRTTATVMAAVLADHGAPATVVAETLTAVLLRAIEEDPTDRWNDLVQFRAALDSATNKEAAPPGRRETMSRRGCGHTMVGLVAAGLVLWFVSHYIA